MIRWVIPFACLLTVAAQAADLPRQSVNDGRVRYITYKPDDVVIINVRRGVITRVVFERDEKITVAGAGFASACDKDELEWCIRADVDTNQVWVKPRDKATHNNLEVATSKRDYSFKFVVLPDTGAGAGATDEMYRVIFQYPVAVMPLPPALFANPLTQGAASSATLAAKVGAATEVTRPVIRNKQYSMDTIGSGEEISPTLAFDDGRFTYLQFPNNREVPSPFIIGGDGAEARVNFHMDNDLMVLHKVAKRIVLRLGSAVVGIWNDGYDIDGVATPNGTTDTNLKRELK